MTDITYTIEVKNIDMSEKELEQLNKILENLKELMSLFGVKYAQKELFQE